MAGGRVVRGWAAGLAVVAMTAAAGVVPSAGAAVSAAPIDLPATEVSSPALASPAPGRRDLFWTEAGKLRQRYLLEGGSWGGPSTVVVP